MLLLQTGCGYAVVRGDRPFGAGSIAVVPFAESEPVGLAIELTDAITALLAADGVRIIGDESAADAVFTGRIIAATTTRSPTVGSNAPVPAYSTGTSITASLTRPDGTLLWTTRLHVTEDFLASTGTEDTVTSETESRRRRALRRIAERAAREIHERLVIADAVAQEG
ncbi:MAG: LPS assembly lipoprotein LptE [Myxococcota bacterium]